MLCPSSLPLQESAVIASYFHKNGVAIHCNLIFFYFLLSYFLNLYLFHFFSFFLYVFASFFNLSIILTLWIAALTMTDKRHALNLQSHNEHIHFATHLIAKFKNFAFYQNLAIISFSGGDFEKSCILLFCKCAVKRAKYRYKQVLL